MDIKTYLSQAFVLDRLLKAKESKIKELQEKKYSLGDVSKFGDKVQTSKKTDPMAQVLVQLMDLTSEYQADIHRILALQKEISQTIDKLEQLDLRLILQERYINLKKWEEIAVDNNYSYRWVLKLHGQALKRLGKEDTKRH